MKNKRKSAIIIVCILMMGIISVHAEGIQPMYTSIEDLTCSLSISSGTASCSATIIPTNSSYASSLSMTLKRSTNGVLWSYVTSWSTTGSGIFGTTLSKSATVSSGYQYRLFVTGTVKDANGIVIETAYKNSPIIAY